MAFENRRNLTNSLEIQPWSSLKLSHASPYLVKYFFSDTDYSYKILLYDGTQLWSENMIEKETFERKCKTFNPNIEADLSSLLQRVEVSLKESLQSSNASVTEKDRECLEMTVKSNLHAGIAFTWTFTFQHASSELFSDHVTNPLTIMVTELLRRQKELFYLLERKDREIQDYKDQGSVVSRKHLETPFFDGNTFQNTSNVNEDFLKMCSDPQQVLNSFANESVSNLYRNVVMNAQSNENRETIQANENAPAIGSGSSAFFDTVPVVGTREPDMSLWANEKRIPHSIVNDNVDGQPQHQPQQSIEQMATVSPEEDEKNRREALRKRLQDENERKNKKKKRKINL